MPSDETRRLLRAFGVAVTAFEDAVQGKTLVDEIRTAEGEARARLQEVSALIDRLRDQASAALND